VTQSCSHGPRKCSARRLAIALVPRSDQIAVNTTAIVTCPAGSSIPDELQYDNAPPDRTRHPGQGRCIFDSRSRFTRRPSRAGPRFLCICGGRLQCGFRGPSPRRSRDASSRSASFIGLSGTNPLNPGKHTCSLDLFGRRRGLGPRPARRPRGGLSPASKVTRGGIDPPERQLHDRSEEYQKGPLNPGADISEF
jgi:hypothetical protein